MRQVRQVGLRTFFGGLFKKDVAERQQVWDAVFRPIRQPAWWQADDQYHAPGYAEPISELERQLRSGEFVVAAEISPPASVATGKLLRDIEMIKPYAWSAPP